MSDKDAEKDHEEIEYLSDPQEKPDEEKKTADAGPDGAAGSKGGEEKKGEGEDNHRLKGKIKKHDTEIKQLKKEKEKLKDQYLRALAEMENQKKRLEREKSEYTQYALSEFLLELLSVMDNFERALNLPDQNVDGKTFRQGIDLIYRMYQNLLFKQGVQPIEITDKTFNPNLHHAMVTEESEEVHEPEVSQELQKGYKLHNRLLRPALVKVVIPKKS